MIKESALGKIFPSESVRHIGTGVKSAAFLTKSGKIIRGKPRWLGTYAKEKKILDFLRDNGGIEIKIPKLDIFTRGMYAFSAHDGITGQTMSNDMFMQLPPARQKKFAGQLADALIRLYRIGGLDVLSRHKTGLWRCVWNYLKLKKYVSKKGMAKKYWVMCRAERNAAHVGIIHGDLHLRNIIADRDFNVSGIIDFDGAKIGPFEHNLRKLPPPLTKFMTDYLKSHGVGINPEILAWHRIVFLFKKIKKSKTASDKAAWIRELVTMF